MKLKMIIVSMLAIAALASCNNENTDNPEPPVTGNNDIAYLSIQVVTQPLSRASGNQPSETTESELKTLYLVTFNENGIATSIPGSADHFIKIDGNSTKPEVIKVSAAAKKLLVVANPGTELKDAFSGIKASSTFAEINAQITGTNLTVAEINSNGFTMINSGNEGDSPKTNDIISDPLIDISNHIVKIEEGVTEEQAKTDADANRVPVQIERLASKIQFKQGDPVMSVNGTFTFGNWTIDAVNSTFYPFAKKTLLEVTHTGSFYKKNFYTEDPNFTGSDGIKKAVIDDLKPVLPTSDGWKDATTAATTIYCIENTMAAAEQKFGNATRVVIKGTFYPKGHTTNTGDWFSYADLSYDNFDALKAAYAVAADGSNLKDAGNRFYTILKTAYLATGATDIFDTKASLDLIEQTEFETISTAISSGGELAKGTKDEPNIRWYQGGLCYYYYEIRHDNETVEDMGFGKYGVVRNNSYLLTLNSVSGPGTPWYPDIDNPGPGDPDPKDPIDQSGILGIEVSVADWILWETPIDL